jgi:hypothetical protein
LYAALQQFKIVTQSSELFLKQRHVAPATAFDDAGIDQRGQTHQQPGEEKQQYISHS